MTYLLSPVAPFHEKPLISIGKPIGCQVGIYFFDITPEMELPIIEAHIGVMVQITCRLRCVKWVEKLCINLFVRLTD